MSAPAKNPDVTFVLGVNEEVYNKEKHHIISMGSCTTNCLAPVVKVLHNEFGLERGLMTTISWCQRPGDPRPAAQGLKESKGTALSMIPTTTGAAKAIAEVIPEMKGRMDGLSIRVPTPTRLLVGPGRDTGQGDVKEEVNNAFRKYAAGPMKGILAATDKELVSSDFIGNPHSSIVDLPETFVTGGRMVKVLSWYDNEWGFSTRMVDLLTFVMK